jgi:Peptidase family M28
VFTNKGKIWTSSFIVATVAIFAVTRCNQASGQETGDGSAYARAFETGDSASPELWWPLPPSAQAYGAIDGRRILSFDEEIVALTEKDRNGQQYWGRIAGFQSSVDVQDWVEAKFRQIGLTVQRPSVTMTPQWVPFSWKVTASSNGKSINLESAWPKLHSAGTAAGGLDLDVVWVGLGTAADFAGKDVHGKAVLIDTYPTPTTLINSGDQLGSERRAMSLGAAVVLDQVAIPGNTQAAVQGGAPSIGGVPILTLGDDDGVALRQMIEQAPSGEPVRVHVELNVKTVPDLTTSVVIGVLPGQTDENIVLVAHSDSFFDGADDNASGVAEMVSLAEYFSKVPKEQRRRTMYFIATPDHHGGSNGMKWVHANMQSMLEKAALILNCEHAAMTMWDWEVAGEGVTAKHFPEGTTSNTLPNTNGLASLSWYVNGSARMKTMFVNDLALFGVITQLPPIYTTMGDTVCVHLDAPSADVIDHPTFFHTNRDVPGSVVPASGLERVGRAYAKFIDDVNTLSMHEVQPVAVELPKSSNPMMGTMGCEPLPHEY